MATQTQPSTQPAATSAVQPEIPSWYPEDARKECERIFASYLPLLESLAERHRRLQDGGAR
jgi:hypothetical protein